MKDVHASVLDGEAKCGVVKSGNCGLIVDETTDITIQTRRLVTTNRWSVSVRGRLSRIFLTSSLIIMQNVVVVSHSVCTHVGGPKHFGDVGGSVFLG